MACAVMLAALGAPKHLKGSGEAGEQPAAGDGQEHTGKSNQRWAFMLFFVVFSLLSGTIRLETPYGKGSFTFEPVC